MVHPRDYGLMSGGSCATCSHFRYESVAVPAESVTIAMIGPRALAFRFVVAMTCAFERPDTSSTLSWKNRTILSELKSLPGPGSYMNPNFAKTLAADRAE